MKSVYKYPLQISALNIVQMPSGARVLHVADQAGVTTVWALVDPEVEKVVNRYFWVFGTGQPIDDPDPLAYLGTSMAGGFVWHVFEEIK